MQKRKTEFKTIQQKAISYTIQVKNSDSAAIYMTKCKNIKTNWSLKDNWNREISQFNSPMTAKVNRTTVKQNAIYYYIT